jgi:hypothetical protein
LHLYHTNSGKHRETAGDFAVFGAPKHRQSRISAADEVPLADNFLEEQRKQREWPSREWFGACSFVPEGR